MRDLAILTGLVGLFGLALLTASWNVRATQHGYRVAERVREAEHLRLIIAHRRDQCRDRLRTESLADAVDALGITESDLFPVLPASVARSALALGAQ